MFCQYKYAQLSYDVYLLFLCVALFVALPAPIKNALQGVPVAQGWWAGGRSLSPMAAEAINMQPHAQTLANICCVSCSLFIYIYIRLLNLRPGQGREARAALWPGPAPLGPSGTNLEFQGPPCQPTCNSRLVPSWISRLDPTWKSGLDPTWKSRLEWNDLNLVNSQIVQFWFSDGKRN